jgi:hypothetical protein
MQDGLDLSVQRLPIAYRRKGRFELFCKRFVDADKVKTVMESYTRSRHHHPLAHIDGNTHTVKHAFIISNILLHLRQVRQFPYTQYKLRLWVRQCSPQVVKLVDHLFSG